MTIGIIRSTRIIIYFNPIYCPKFSWLIWCILWQIFRFWYSIIILLEYSKIINNFLRLFWRYIYIYFFRYFFSCSTCSILFLTVTELFCGEFAETFIILSAILLLIKSPVTCGVLWIALLEAFLKTSVADCLAWSKNFRL